MPRQLLGTAIAANTITTTQLQTTIVQNIEGGGGPRVTSLIYPGDDTAANTVGGQTVYINGSGFASNSAVYINGNSAPSVSFISSSNLAITTPALSAATYPVYVINPENGATAIFIPGLLVSGDPTWVTSAGSLSASQDSASAWSYSVSATSDSAVTYALASGSSLPTGISLAANGLISGTMSSPPESETTYNFTVEATDAENQNATRAFSVTVSTGEGVLFANNVLLIHADGTNNQNNHHFLDSSNNNFTITRNGNATQGSFSPFSQTGWSVYFGSSTSNLILPSNSSFAIAAGNFTIEGFVNFTAWSGTNQRIFLQGVNGTDGIALYRNSGANNLIVGINNTEVISYSWSPVLGKWYHLAVVRSGTGSNQVALYIDGVSVATGTANASVAQNQFIIGGLNWASSYNMQGYISNVRYSNNARTVVVPTSAYTSDANTIALACQSNRFVDNSNNNLSITVNGTTSVVPFSPFAPTAAYSTANVGGSVYLDGSGDYLTPADSTATDLGISQQPFTLEWWTYFTTTSGGQYIISKGGGFGGWNSTTGWQYVFSIEFSSSVFSLGYYNGSSYTYWQPSFSSVGVFGRWNHMVLSYDGTNLSAYVNGTRIGTTTVTNFSKPSSSNKCGIGSTLAVTSEAYHYNGYISDFRIVQGNAVYDPTLSTLTVPTAPLTNVANTSLLLNFTNAGIFDQTAKTVIETVGDAKVSTAQYKYGTGSIAFDGSGDWLYIPTTLQFNPRAPFTIEFWTYPISTSTVTWISGSSSNFYIETFSSTLYVGDGSTNTISTTPPSTGVWTHVALSFDGTTYRLYYNGTQQSTGTTLLASNILTSWYIGAKHDGTRNFNGYIDDLRITKGYARYTSNFTPPAAALKDK